METARKRTRFLMVHADDAGLAHAQNKAIIECLKKGVVNSYSIMVPCKAFEEIADFAKQHPQFDYGIHLTLTCEWHAHRFGPVLPATAVPSLVDGHGHFYKTREALRQNARAEEVYQELRAQIDRAYSCGLQPTHLDSHMYSVGSSPDIFASYKKLGKEYGLPVLINNKLMQMVGLAPELAKNYPYFQFDDVQLAIWEDYEKGHLRHRYLDILNQLRPGLNLLLVHPALDDQEMRKLTVDHPNFGSKWRQMDYETFMDGETAEKLKENDIKLISWRGLKDFSW